MPNFVLVLNLGSSSVKYALFREEKRLLSGLAEKLGTEDAVLIHRGPRGELVRRLSGGSHQAALEHVFSLLTDSEHGALESIDELAAVGHRTVHGGTELTKSTIVDDAVKLKLRSLVKLAPLHNPLNLLGMEICEKLLPTSVVQVAVFDTAFHTTIPEYAYRYAIPRKLADERSLRRFGFHGTSHDYVSRAAADYLCQKRSELRIITCHLGNGSSITAIDRGRSVDTSMGLTPLEGLVMGTRSGDIDPGLILNLLETEFEPNQIRELLNKQSGLLGLSGISGDMRKLENAARTGDKGAQLAIDAFCYRVKKYLGAYAAALSGLDVLVFTGGIGENAARIRERILSGLEFLGVILDHRLNAENPTEQRQVTIASSDASAVKVLVIRTDEEKMIARETVRAMDNR